MTGFLIIETFYEKDVLKELANAVECFVGAKQKIQKLKESGSMKNATAHFYQRRGKSVHNNTEVETSVTENNRTSIRHCAQ